MLLIDWYKYKNEDKKETVSVRKTIQMQMDGENNEMKFEMATLFTN